MYATIINTIIATINAPIAKYSALEAFVEAVDELDFIEETVLGKELRDETEDCRLATFELRDETED